MAHISTANVTRRAGDPTNAAAGGLARSPQRQAQPSRRRLGAGGAASATVAGEALPIPNFGGLAVPAVQPAVQPGGGGDTGLQSLIDQIARNTQGGAAGTGAVTNTNVQSGSSFQPDPRIADLIRELQRQRDNIEFTDTTGARRIELDGLIAQLSGGNFRFDASRDAETKAFRVATERARQEAQVGLSERRAADPTNTGGFDADTASLRERSGEAIGRFGAGRASQRRSEVFQERTAGINASLSNLTQLGGIDVNRFNASVANANTTGSARITALNAMLQREAGRRGGFESNRAFQLQLAEFNARQNASGGGDSNSAQNQLLALLASGQTPGRSAPGINQEAASNARADRQRRGEQDQREFFLQNETLARQRQQDEASAQQAQQDEQFRRRQQRAAERQDRARRRQAQAQAREDALRREQATRRASNVQF